MSAYLLFEAESEEANPFISKVGGQPSWIRRDYAPTTYAGSVPMHFLMQVEPAFEFETVTGAPRQKLIDSQTGKWISYENSYLLFIGSGICFFGTPDPDQRFVYVVIQN